MIDVLKDRTISFDEAGKLLNPPVHRRTIYHWGSAGVRGHKLETVWRGGRHRTTVQAVETFMRKINNGDGNSE